MAATKYQVLYRAKNPVTGGIITNNPSIEVEQFSELYHEKHKIAVGNAFEKSSAINEKNNIIMEDNDSTNDKFSQLYMFTGTKRLNKQNWIEESTGYVIRDFSDIRDKITNAGNGDYSGEYLLFDGDTPENGTVVAKENPILKQYGESGYVIKSNINAANGKYYADLDEVKKELISATIGEIDFNNYPLEIKLSQIVGSASGPGYFTVPFSQDDGRIICFYNLAVMIGKEMTFGVKMTYDERIYYDYLNESNMTNYIVNNQLAASYVSLLPKHIKTYTIPAHLEESVETPYCIHDTYKKISQEPWIEYTTESSFESALQKATALVQKIGLENVKLIKVVPTDQFLKIK